MDELKNYLIENYISFKELQNNVIELGGKKYEYFEPNEDQVFFDKSFSWDCDRTDYDGYIFKFGGVWYTLKKGEEKNPKLNRVKWIGKIDIKDYDEIGFSGFLGVHGPLELMNGTGAYSDWCKKAKFLGIKNLGLCEKATLAGTFKFQTACLKEGIKPIFGMEVPIKIESKDLNFTVKAYAKNEKGWLSLLSINKKINVDKEFLSDDDFIELREQLFVVLDPKTIDFDDIPKKWNMFSHQFYYQFDTVIYDKEDRDKWYLKNLKKFFNSKYRPIAIYDAYYIEKEYKILRTLLNKVDSKVNHESSNQYFKNSLEYLNEFQKLFKEEDDDKFANTYIESINNLKHVCNNCNFEIQIEVRHLPKYIMTEEESKKYSSNVEMFEDLVYEGLENHIELIEEYGEDVLVERIGKELEVIKKGKLVDYFLILRDIINWAINNNILQGAARGSGAGSLINYLLGITRVNPFKYNLLFERFLNEGRLFRTKEEEMVRIMKEDNSEIELNASTNCKIIRKNKEMLVKAKNIQEGDEIISYK